MRAIRPAAWAWALAASLFGVLGACYKFNPDNGACTIACPDNACPNGLACSSGLCAEPGMTCQAPGDGGGSDGQHVGSGSDCYGTIDVLQVCFATVPSGAIMLPANLDTDTDASCTVVPQASGRDLCVVAGTTVTTNVGGTHATGIRPLVVVATDTISIDTVLDAGSHRTGPNSSIGAGADDASCGSGTPPAPGGGGAGGSFQGAGGNGGNTPGEAGGVAVAAAGGVGFVRGGCPGEAGTGDPSSLGHGGGAVWLIAVSSINIAAQIDVSGEGARQSTIAMDTGAGSAEFPGGGGGAGGLLGLDAPMIAMTSSASLSAGGGGGAGGGGTGGASGRDASVAGACAAGGQAGAGGGDGGSGSCNATYTGAFGRNSGTTERASGGGGGGAGFIVTPTGVAIQNAGSATNIQPAL